MPAKRRDIESDLGDAFSREAESLSISEIRIGAVYEADRERSRDHLSRVQTDRRVALGQDAALVFENRGTVRAALEEHIRLQRGADPAGVSAALETFAALLPPAGQLLATIHLELADAAALADRSAVLKDLPAALWLDVAGRRLPARIAAEEDLEAGSASVVFELDEGHRSDWMAARPVHAVVEHPSLRVRQELTARQRSAIASDFAQ